MLTPLTGFTTLQFSGEKTQTFLQGQLTCDMRELTAHGTHSLTAVCDHKGRMLANFWVVNWHDDFLFILPQSLSDTVKNHLKKYAVFSKVSITHAEDFFIAEINNAAAEENAAIFINLPSKNRYLLIAEKNPFPTITVNTDETIWKKNNIHDHLCILYPETSLLFTPQMIALEKLGGVSFTKGCYVGQEIVARTQYLGTLKRHLHHLKIESNQLVKPGDTLKNEKNEAIGVVTESVQFTEKKYEILAVIQDQMFSSYLSLCWHGVERVCKYR